MPASRPTLLRPSTRHRLDLSGLLPGQATVGTAVDGITLDARLVTPGDLYVALPGRTRHGAEFAAEAAAHGARAVLTDPAGRELAASAGIPVAVVDDPRRAMAEVAAALYDHPGDRLTLCAVTGTNGKTTTTYLLEAALSAAGISTGLVGTIGFRLDGRPLPGARTTITTPESPELQALLGYLAERGARAVLMEVSSHALVLGRVDALVFDVAAFTNLGRDHLDFHGDVESYFEAKAQLFTADRTRHAVLNVDDPRGRQLAERVRAAGAPELTTVSLDGPADCRLLAVRTGAAGQAVVQAEVRGRGLGFELDLPGEYNLRNALTALAMADVIGVDPVAAAAGLAVAEVPGRMQRVDLGPGAPAVYVDFAHTPQAVASALRALGKRRRLVVLGCGGDRDTAKRGPMGAAAARNADLVVVTDDNPRSEDPATIRAAVLAGARAAVRDEHLPTTVTDGGDRRSAIRLALQQAGPADVVVILGKGHEEGQEIGGTTLPFADPAVAAEEWRTVRAGTERSR